MKKVLMFVVMSCALFAQSSNKREAIIRKDTAGIYAVELTTRTYTSSTIDTSIAYAMTDYKNTFVTVQSLDSARCRISYQLSADGTNWGVATTKDSLATATATGDLKTVDVTTQIAGSPFARFIFDFTITGTPQGTITNTYDAVLTRKNF
jgi:hypothetical protein